MSSRKVVGIVLYGEIKLKDIWKNWLLDAKSIFSEMGGCKPTHITILCDSLDSKLRTLSRNEKRVLEVINNGETINAISLYSLKKEFKSVIENEFCLILNSRYKYAYCEMPFEKFNESLGKKLLQDLNNYVECKSSEIFSMERNQVAFNYVMKGKGNDISKYPTLEIISN